ncbi:hypothetical protein KEM60_03179 [Austwickia sp. TVS 96-490-7B]|nr:hypothetical protein [Austwickia sp. TVS 96-490-7B]
MSEFNIQTVQHKSFIEMDALKFNASRQEIVNENF